MMCNKSILTLALCMPPKMSLCLILTPTKILFRVQRDVLMIFALTFENLNLQISFMIDCEASICNVANNLKLWSWVNFIQITADCLHLCRMLKAVLLNNLFKSNMCTAVFINSFFYNNFSITWYSLLIYLCI